MRSKIILTILLLVAGFATAFATPQIPDILIYEGKEYPIQNELLGAYFAKFPERNPKKEEETCSALWRGYQATYEVLEGVIYLKDVMTNACFGPKVSELKKVVPTGRPLAVDWYSGLLVAFYGSNDEDPYGHASLDAWEKYSFFEVSNGKVLEVRHFDNRGYRKFKKQQFEAYKKTNEYQEEIKRQTRHGNVDRGTIDANLELWILFRIKSFLVK